MPKPVVEVRRDPRRNNAPLCTGYWPDGNPCDKIAVRGTTKCPRHGGKSLRGLASPSFKHGRYSKDLPTRVALRTEALLDAPTLLSLSPEIAVLQARLGELFRRVDTGESGATWIQARTALAAFSEASATGNMAAMNQTFAELQRLITQGASEAQAWEEIGVTVDRLKGLAKTEADTLVKLQQIVTVQQLMTYQKALTDSTVRAVRAHTDPPTGHKILTAIQADFTDLAHRGDRR